VRRRTRAAIVAAENGDASSAKWVVTKTLNSTPADVRRSAPSLHPQLPYKQNARGFDWFLPWVKLASVEYSTGVSPHDFSRLALDAAASKPRPRNIS